MKTRVTVRDYCLSMIFVATLCSILVLILPGQNIQAATTISPQAINLWLEQTGIIRDIPSFTNPKIPLNRSHAMLIAAREMGCTVAGPNPDYLQLMDDQRFKRFADRMGVESSQLSSPLWLEAPVTRAWAACWAASLFYDVMAYGSDPDGNDLFIDLKAYESERQVYSSIKFVHHNSLMLGFPDHTFRPADPISLSDLTMILARGIQAFGKGSQIVEIEFDHRELEWVYGYPLRSREPERYLLLESTIFLDQGKYIDPATISPGCTVALFLHDNRAVCVGVVITHSQNYPGRKPLTILHNNIAAVLPMAVNIQPMSPKSVRHCCHNLLYRGLFQLPLDHTCVQSDSYTWVLDRQKQLLYTFDAEGTHRQTLQLPAWIVFDDIFFNNQTLYGFNAANNETYQIFCYPFDSKTDRILPTITTDKDMLAQNLSVCLLYLGGQGSNSIHRYNKQDLLPLVAYINQSGQIIDRFFTSFVFLAQYSPKLNGHSFAGDVAPNGPGLTEEDDLQALFDEYFLHNYNLAALEDAAHTLSLALGNPDLRIGVYFGIPTPNYLTWNKSNLSPLPKASFATNEREQKRINAAWWCMRHLQERFRINDFHYLQLEGFYYQTEQGSDKDPLQEQFPLLSDALGLTALAIPGITSQFPESFFQHNYQPVLLQSSHVFLEPSPGTENISLGVADSLMRTLAYGFMLELPYDFKSRQTNTRFYEQLLFANGLPDGWPLGCFQSYRVLVNSFYSGFPERQAYDAVYSVLGVQRRGGRQYSL